MSDALDEVVRRMGAEEQRQLAGSIASLISPFGSLGPEVISPGVFRSLLDRFQEGMRVGDPGLIHSVQAQCGAVIERIEEEPPGNGFFAFGAVVALYYVTEAATVDPSAGAVNAVRRVLDLLGAADDDGFSDDL